METIWQNWQRQPSSPISPGFYAASREQAAKSLEQMLAKQRVIAKTAVKIAASILSVLTSKLDSPLKTRIP